MKKRRKGRIKIFSVFLLLITVAAAWGSYTVYNKLWAFLETYDDEPVKAIDTYIEILESEDFDRIFELNNIEPNEFNSFDEYKEKFIEMFGGNLSGLKYRLTGAEGESEEYEIYSGEILAQRVSITPDGGSFALKTEKIDKPYELTVTVPKGATVTVNGVSLSDEYITEEYEIDQYLSLDNHTPPTCQVYYVDGLLNPAKCEVSIEGQSTELKVYNEQKIEAIYTVADAEKEAFCQIAEHTAVQYAMYITQDINFGELAPLLAENSEFYRSIKGYTNEWYAEHEFTYDNMSFGEVILHDSDHFSVDLSFTYHIVRPVRTYDYDVNYDMYFVKSGEEWLLATLD